MRKIITILIIFLFLTGCASTDRYDSGYADGHSDGYSSGFDAGYEIGCEDAYDFGYEDGLADAYNGKVILIDEHYWEIYEEGYEDGRAYYKENLSELFWEIGPQIIAESLWDNYDADIIEYINEYSGRNYVMEGGAE